MGSWKMTWRFFLSSRLSRLFLMSAMFLPRTVIEPPSGFMSSMICVSVVDLPEPDSPTSAMVSPSWILNDTWSTAVMVPLFLRMRPLLWIGKVFTRSLTSSTIGLWSRGTSAHLAGSGSSSGYTSW